MSRPATGLTIDDSPVRADSPLIAPWAPGPAAGTADAVVVSVTSFRADHLRDLPLIVSSGLRLRMGWYAMPGAVGLWLWLLPLRRRSGSISVWTSEEELGRFVRLPRHVDIMRRYRDRGTVTATSWQSAGFAGREILERAGSWIAEQ